MTAPPHPLSRRPLLAVLASRSMRHPSRAALVRDVVRSLAQTVGVALLAAPLAVLWGIGHAESNDYLGPHQASFASNYRGEVEVDLGPLGNAYLPSPRAPLGLKITVGGVVAAGGGDQSFFSERTLTAYAGIFAEPDEAVAGVVERLVDDVVRESLLAELALLGAFAVVVGRRRLLAERLVRSVSARRAAVAYLTGLAVLSGVTLATPRAPLVTRIPVSLAAENRFHGLTVDSALLADGLDRGIKGVTLLTQRQQRAVRSYISSADADLRQQAVALPTPRSGESLMLGFSDLHCNQAMTELVRRLVLLTRPTQVLSSGDDTVNGTAAERFCVTREARIAVDRPVVVATGNHDTDVTEAQMRNAEMVVLDGQVVDSGGLTILGDDDPERNLPFSVERVTDRPETEQQLGQRLVDTAVGKDVDALLVHQPAAAEVIMATPDPPARLVLWGHFHSEDGPRVVTHSDGSWTVGMQQGTAGGVRQPTFTSFSTPFSPPLIRADVYFYFRDDATGLVTGVQPVHFQPDATVDIAPRVDTGNVSELPFETRVRLSGSEPAPSATPRR